MNFTDIIQLIKDMKPITMDVVEDIKKCNEEQQKEIFKTIDEIIERKKNIKDEVLYNN